MVPRLDDRVRPAPTTTHREDHPGAGAAGGYVLNPARLTAAPASPLEGAAEGGGPTTAAPVRVYITGRGCWCWVRQKLLLLLLSGDNS